jgi:hypothetical protein
MTDRNATGLAFAVPLIDMTCRLAGPFDFVNEGRRALSRHGVLGAVRRHDKEIGLPSYFTLDACRHGGMTELEEAELTDGQGRALSTHKTQQSYEGYAKRTAKRMLSATKKRHAHRLANEQATNVQNAPPHPFRMEKEAS